MSSMTSAMLLRCSEVDALARARRARSRCAASASRPLLIYPLKQVAPVLSLGVLYVLAVVVVSIVLGSRASASARASSAPPRSTSSTCRRSVDFTLRRRTRLGRRCSRSSSSRSPPGLVAELARARSAGGSSERRQEADLASRDGAAAARQREQLEERSRLAAERLAEAIGAALGEHLAAETTPSRRARRAPCSRCTAGGRPIGALMLPGTLLRRRARRASPSASSRSLESILGRGAAPRRAAGRGRRDRRAAPQRRAQDGRAALRLP